MFTKNNHSPIKYMFSKQLNLSDFGFEKKTENYIKKFQKTNNNDINQNKLIKFIEYTFNYANICLPRYSSYFSNHIYTQPVLFTILAIKVYTRTTYRQITDLLQLSDRIKQYLGIKNVPHFTTLQKFFQKLPSSIFKTINQLILRLYPVKGEIIALDGTGFTNDYADKYYAIIRAKERKSYVKNHIAIDIKTRLILNYATQRGPRSDTKFAISSIRQTRKYNPHYILADRAYDTEPIRKCINEYVGAFDQIPIKTRAKKGHYRLNSLAIFRPKIYGLRSKCRRSI